jgi:hypothetical protein
MKKPVALTRRTFMFRGAAALGAAVALPTIVPSTVLGAAAPSNRITMGMIGMGGQMGGHFRAMLGRSDVQVLAVCDVDRKKRENAKAQTESTYAQVLAAGTYQGCDAYREYERVCERPDIDAVLIATPDHWHAAISLAAIKTGKDVYCEKPMTLTIHEGRLVSNACRQYGTIYQVGSQQRSEWAFRTACEIVRNGWIGKVKTCYASLGRFAPPATLPEQPIPEGFDYDRWDRPRGTPTTTGALKATSVAGGGASGNTVPARTATGAPIISISSNGLWEWMVPARSSSFPKAGTERRIRRTFTPTA